MGEGSERNRKERVVVETVLRIRELHDRLESCIDQLNPEEQEVLEILLEDGGDTILRISYELGVSKATAYRRKKQVLGRLLKLFCPFDVILK